VRFGQLMRNLHRWTAHAMIVLVFLHMMRVFYTGAYKPPREFNWVVGVILLASTLFVAFTGYLLPWDQLAIWAITVGTEIGGSAPVLGSDVNFVLLGGFEIGENALIRFYTLHVLVMPLLMAIFMAVHFWRIRRDGGLARPL
jgi:quinol-cytochrome oxidoreductase complex cytochrome b subunit